jgi:S1-C subfamily serine protease
MPREADTLEPGMKRTLIALVAGSALLLAACSTPRTIDTLAQPRVFPTPSTATIVQSDNAIERVVQQVLPAVVNVVASGPGGSGEGTGFVVRQDGIVVTNYHVVEGATSVKVLSSDADPKTYVARVIGGDVEADLAVLQIDAQNLATVPLGDSSQLQLGQQVVAIGYALGLQGGPSVTAGIVSSLSRRITVQDQRCLECTNGQRTYTDVIQTDAAINPGNSGGPLVDLAGNVVGINTAGTTQAENVGFAIQIDSVKPTVYQAADNPDQPVAFMGIGSEDASAPEVQFNLNNAVDQGAAIVNVVQGGPADDAGIQIGDVVVEFDGQQIATADELGTAIRSHQPGDQVDVVVVHPNGERETVSVTLGVNPVPTG